MKNIIKPVWSGTTDQIKSLIFKKSQKAIKKKQKDSRPADFSRADLKEKYVSAYKTMANSGTKWSHVHDPYKNAALLWLKKLHHETSAKGNLEKSKHASKTGNIREDGQPLNPGSGAKTTGASPLKPTEPVLNKAFKSKRIKDIDLRNIPEAKDLIGKKTASVEDIAKKHSMSVDQVNAQIDKGHKVEREHTDSDAQAREIARDHLDEFPDYYDRLDKMETKAKKDMKKEDYESYEKALSNKPKKREGLVKLKKTPLDNIISYYNKQNPDKKPMKEAAEENDGSHLYHVTHTSHVSSIQKHGLHPRAAASNWVEAGSGKRYGKGEVYTFTHHNDAKRWAMNMDWAHHQKLGSGKISIIKMKTPKDHPFEEDQNDPLEVLTRKGKALKTNRPINKSHFVSITKFTTDSLKEEWLSDIDVLARIISVNEDAGAANSVGGGNIAGMPTADSGDTSIARPIGKMNRRKRVVNGKVIFASDPETFNRATAGKKNFEHYETYLEGSTLLEEIQDYVDHNPSNPIILWNEKTGAMVYLKYGSN